MQTNNKQFKIAVTFLTRYKGIFNVTNSNNKFYCKETITDGNDFFQIVITPVAYGNDSLNNEMRRFIIDEEHFTESDCLFQRQPVFSALRPFIDTSPEGPINSSVFDDSFRNLLGFH